MARSWPIARILLITFAVCVVAATLLALGLGFDLLVTPPSIDETLDFPTRLEALQPFRVALWPWDAAATVLFTVAFAALALLADPIAGIAGADRRAGVMRSAILASGLIGVVSGLLYFGGTQATIAIQYCDCGFKAEEVISQFWARAVLTGATDVLGYGAVAFGALGVALATAVLDPRVGSTAWRWIGRAAAVSLAGSIVVQEVSDTPAGDLLLAIATGLLLPAWALLLARSDAVADADANSLAGAS